MAEEEEEETMRFPTWEDSLTEEQARKITTYFLHDARSSTSLGLISSSTSKSSWLASWWRKTVQSYEEAYNDDERGRR